MWLTFGLRFVGSWWTSPVLVVLVVLSAFASTPAVSGWEHDEPAGTLVEGNKCRVRSGEPGICTRIEACVAYADGLRKKTIQYSSLVRCSFVGITEVICCPTSPWQPLANLPTPTPTTTTSTTTPSTTTSTTTMSTTTTIRPIVVGDVTLTGDEEFIDLSQILARTTTTTRRPQVMPNNPWNPGFNGDGRNIPNPPVRPPNAGWNAGFNGGVVPSQQGVSRPQVMPNNQWNPGFNGGGRNIPNPPRRPSNPEWNAGFNGGVVPNQQGVNHPAWVPTRPNQNVVFPTATRRPLVMPVNPNAEWIDPSLENSPQGPTSGQFVEFKPLIAPTTTAAPIAQFNDPFLAFQFRPGSDDPALAETSTIRTIVNNDLEEDSLDEWAWSSRTTTRRAPTTRSTTTTTTTTEVPTTTTGAATEANVDWIMDALKNYTTSAPVASSGSLTPLIDLPDPISVTPTTPTKATTVQTVTTRTETDRPSKAACRQYNAANPAQLTFHILDGVPVNPGDYPHMGGLIYNSSGGGNDLELRCGSSLISDRYVLTAAHCVYDPLAPPTLVRFGVVIWNSVEDGNVPVDVEIEDIILHPEYVNPARYHDIALIKLVRAVAFTPFVRPACLRSDAADIDPSVPLVVIGWGVTDISTRTRSNVLLMTNVSTVPLLECNATHVSYGVSRLNRNGLGEGQYCAFDKELKKDSCSADSGGPLHLVRDKETEIVGVVSFGNSCGTAIPSVYTRVAFYLEWIEGIVWPASTS